MLELCKKLRELAAKELGVTEHEIETLAWEISATGLTRFRLGALGLAAQIISDGGIGEAKKAADARAEQCGRTPWNDCLDLLANWRRIDTQTETVKG